MVAALLILMMGAPLAAVCACFVYRARPFVEGANLAASFVVFITAIPLTVLSANGPYHFVGDYVVVDMLGAWVLLCTAIVYLLASIYAVGYMRLLDEDARLWGFYALLAAFALTILQSAVMNNAGL
jgi:hydrogenase-4 component F